MLNCNAYAKILKLKPTPEKGPLIVFVGVRIPNACADQFYLHYGARTLLCNPSHLKSTNSDFADIVVLAQDAFSTADTYEELWRVVKEGGAVVVLSDIKNTPWPRATDPIAPQDYGLLFYREVKNDTWPYSEGVVRKDLAKHFRS